VARALTIMLLPLAGCAPLDTYCDSGSGGASAALPPVLVNELMPNNDSAHADESGVYHDWLELYNAGTEAVDLTGYSLSDDWADKGKAPLPAGTVIEASGFMFFWASASDGDGHLPFGLDSQGEGVGLFAADGTAVDWFEFSAFAADHTLARLPDGSNALWLLAHGTPGGSNVQLEEQTDSLIPRGATWSYLDTGEDPGEGWTSAGFDDGGWASGPAPLGYGDDQATQVGWGDDDSDRHPTTWFRLLFELDSAVHEAAGQASLELRVDDGAVLWLNGEELLRQSMPAGDIDADTLATESVSDHIETSYTSYVFPPSGLLAGENLLAVEVHKDSVSSDDLTLDLSLTLASWVPVE